MSDDCIFCKIINGEAHANKIYEDAAACAFWDLNPAAPIHILIVPKLHIPTLNDIPDGDPLLGHIADVAKKVARQLGVHESGYRLFFNVNRGGGQMVFHLHAHLIAGRDLGSVFITIAVAGAIVWRKLMKLFGK
jgi:histidine triad (HIT) family protein